MERNPMLGLMALGDAFGSLRSIGGGNPGPQQALPYAMQQQAQAQAQRAEQEKAMRGLQALGINIPGAGQQGGLGQAPQPTPGGFMDGAQPETALSAATGGTGGAPAMPPQLQRTIQALAMGGNTEAAYKLASDFAMQSALPKAENPYDRYKVVPGVGLVDLGAEQGPGVAIAAREGETSSFRAASPEEAARFGAAGGQIDDKTGRFYPINPPSGMALETGPDGSLRFVQGPGAGPGSFGNAANNAIDAKLIDTAERNARLQSITGLVEANPQYLESLTVEGALKTWGLEWADRLNPEMLSDEQADYLVRVTESRAEVTDNLNRYIQEITGAAMGVEEAKRIISSMPSSEDSPRMFMAKLRRVTERTEAALARYTLWKKEGGVGKPEDYKPLSEVEKQIRERGAALQQQVADKKITPEQAEAIFAREFGI